MRPHSTYFVSVLGAAFAALCFTVASVVPTTMVAPKPAAGLLDQGSDTITNTVNRASKGDRLRIIVRPPDAEPFEVQAPVAPPDARPRPPDGCESAFGPMDHSSRARLAQDCVT
ncbi:MAG TPA: hypothetical protein VG145_00995 [Xanthobacteraceae bacterium]|jgi:hypothetical protein|nr:hypothetical protein [Xanthobacteraceae bacterium]